MSKKGKEITKLSELVPDQNNYNKGTEFGGALIEKSLRKLGAGRSILLDKNGKIIAGNKTIENAVNAGFKDEDLIVVQTTGSQIVAVQRMDLDLETKMGKEMALADNATAKANIEWDAEAIGADWNSEEMAEWGIADRTEDYSGKNKEADTDGIDDSMVIALKYTHDEYWQAKEQLSKIASTPEQAVWKLLGNDVLLDAMA